MPLASVSGRLAPVAPFDFAQSLQFIRASALMEGEYAVSDGALTRAVYVDGRVLAFRVRATGSVEQPALDYTLFDTQPISPALHAAGADRVGFFLSVADDLAPFYALAQDDPPFAPVLDQLYGYHQVKFLTPFELACWAVLSQRNQFGVTLRMRRALMEAYGGAIEVEGQVFPASPEAGPLAAAGPDEIARVIRHKPKAAWVSAVAHGFLQADEGFLRHAPYEEAEAWLRRLKGIGAWSARFIMLRGLGRMERLPPGDRFIAQAVAQRYGPVPVEALAKRYGPYQGYWAHYLRAAQ